MDKLSHYLENNLFGKENRFIPLENLLSMKFENEKTFLLYPWIPNNSISIFAGEPGVGKSNFMRELCLAFASGFLHLNGYGERFETDNRNCLYVSTEDTEEHTRSAVEKQARNYTNKYKGNVSFLFATDLSQNDLCERLEYFIAKENIKLVIIDSFNDVFEGNDLNSVRDTRVTLNRFYQLCRKFKVAIVFVHHINKRDYGQIPTLASIQGGSGITQKSRSIFCLFKGPHGLRYVTLIKSNYAPSDTESAEYEFDEDSLTFEKTGNGRIEDLIKSNSSSSVKNTHCGNMLFNFYKSSNNPIQWRGIIEYFQGKGLSKSTAKRYLYYMLDEGILEQKVGALYFITEKGRAIIDQLE